MVKLRFGNFTAHHALNIQFADCTWGVKIERNACMHQSLDKVIKNPAEKLEDKFS